MPLISSGVIFCRLVAMIMDPCTRKAGTESALKWMSEISFWTINDSRFLISTAMINPYALTISIPLSISQSDAKGLTIASVGSVSRFPPAVNAFLMSYSDQNDRPFGPGCGSADGRVFGADGWETTAARDGDDGTTIAGLAFAKPAIITSMMSSRVSTA